MTGATLWEVVPLLMLGCGALAVLLIGAVSPDRRGTVTGLVVLLACAAWCIFLPPDAGTGSIGISFTPFARFFTCFFSLTGAAVLLLSHDYNGRRGIKGEEYAATLLFAVFGMAVLSASNNLLTLFLGLEGLTFAFYFLVAIDLNSPVSGEAGLKYLVPGATAAAFTAFGISLLYAGTGTLRIEPMVEAFAGTGMADPLVVAGFGFLLAGMAFKMSLVPAHLWTPDVYQGAPAPVVAFLSTASKGAAVVFFLLLLPLSGVSEPLRMLLRALALLSMILGNLAALRQKNLKRMLAYSAIAQMGYVMLALLSASVSGFAAAAYYLLAYTGMNLAAFGAITALTAGEEPGDVKDYRGAGYSRPFAAGVLALAMFGLAGIPPTAGFLGKFFIFAAALRGGEITLAVIGIITAAISVFYYLRVVVSLYMQPAQDPPAMGTGTLPERIVLACAAASILILGVAPAPLIDFISSLFGS